MREKLREFFRQEVRPELRAVAALNNDDHRHEKNAWLLSGIDAFSTLDTVDNVFEMLSKKWFEFHLTILTS